MSSGDDDMMYDSDDQDYNYSEDDYAYEDDGDGVSSDDEDDNINSILDKKENFTVLKEEDIENRQAEDIAEVSSVLQVSDEAACILLRHYNWKVVEVKDEWFADEEKVRKEAGIIHKLPIDYTLGFGGVVICGICFERCEGMLSVGCGHLYCKVCWVGYLHTAITDGPGCLMLRCPEPSCYAAVGQDMVDKVGLSEEDKAKYKHYILRTYVENCRTIKWCPAPDCEHAVKFALGCDNYDVVCDCSNAFCWNCAEDAHRPVDCEMVATWALKNSSEAENTNWILANSKPCPKCKRPIEKNHGCMHMTCTPPCKFEFCWLCLGDWKQHGEATGGFYACNSYTKAKAAGQLDEEEIKRDMAKQSLERYTHYYERWASNGNSRNKALKELEDMQNVHLLKLSKSQNQPESQLQFCLEAWRQIVECRRVLKWTYAYGFYLPAHESAKKHLFEYLQGQADAALERLHHCAEKELMKYINDDTETGQNTEASKVTGQNTEASKVTEDFNAFRSRLASLTRVTKNFFENLVKALENGLSDVDSQETSLQQGIATIKEESDGLPHQWVCDQCTYVNPPTSSECSVCGVGVAPFEIDQ